MTPTLDRPQAQPRFAWTGLNNLPDGRLSFGTLQSPADGWEAIRGQPENIWEEHMDEFVWIRVVTPDWEYTERLAE